MTEITDSLEYKDFNGESPNANGDVYRSLRVFLRPSNSVFAQPKFYGEIQFLRRVLASVNITRAYPAILVDFDIF
jgi:hypothetical protein